MTGDDRCAATGKVRHPDRGGARRALRETRAAANTGRKVPCQIYRCGLCSGYHLSSQTRNQYLKWPGRRRHAS